MRHCILVGTLVLIAGCTVKSPTERLTQKWEIDVPCTLSVDPELERIKPQIRSQLAKFVAPYLETVFFTFTEDGQLRLQLNHLVDTRYYRITAQDQNARLRFDLSPQKDFKKSESVLAEFKKEALHLKVGQRTYCLAEH